MSLQKCFRNKDMSQPIFKYVNLHGATEILKNGSLLFSSPLYFNDPFDVSIQTLFGYDPLDLISHSKAFVDLITSTTDFPETNGFDSSISIQMLHSLYRSATSSKKEALLKSLNPDVLWNKENLKNEALDITMKMKALYSCAGILSATKRHDNYLLWAHYADKHQGAVIEFQANVQKDSMLTLMEDVDYTDERPFLYDSHEDFLKKSIFKTSNDILDIYNRKITKTKSLEWRYEEEIRLYQPMLVNIPEGKKYHLLDYHHDEIQSIFLGCKMSTTEKDLISSLAQEKNPNVKIYEMVPDIYKYKLHAKLYKSASEFF